MCWTSLIESSKKAPPPLPHSSKHQILVSRSLCLPHSPANPIVPPYMSTGRKLDIKIKVCSLDCNKTVIAYPYRRVHSWFFYLRGGASESECVLVEQGTGPRTSLCVSFLFLSLEGECIYKKLAHTHTRTRKQYRCAYAIACMCVFVCMSGCMIQCYWDIWTCRQSTGGGGIPNCVMAHVFAEHSSQKICACACVRVRRVCGYV